MVDTEEAKRSLLYSATAFVQAQSLDDPVVRVSVIALETSSTSVSVYQVLTEVVPEGLSCQLHSPGKLPLMGEGDTFLCL
jgi:hypothetical protein